ncbi:MAG TPA: hypothetical protein VHP83_17235 [Aggregatilineaceae bacterium]|nr:hypothetical protein [Aggregatilineaceae bacterium]
MTANDTGDGDTGANDLQNYPVITTRAISIDEQAAVAVNGTLKSTPGTLFRVEIFANAICDYAEGQQFILSIDNMLTASDGIVYFYLSYPQVEGKPYVTATATNLTMGSTSEFSNCHPSLNITHRLE